jgi:hypothetical protein
MKKSPNLRSTRPLWRGGASIIKLSQAGELFRYTARLDFALVVHQIINLFLEMRIGKNE